LLFRTIGRGTGQLTAPCHTLGLLLSVIVHPADVPDRDAARLVRDRHSLPLRCRRPSCETR
jgi:hypothetical protein